MSDHIEIDRAGAVQRIRMSRPDKKNAITRAMYGAMAAALNEGEADDSVLVHLLLGTEGAFSAGNDLNDFVSVATGGEHGGEVAEFMNAVLGADKPIIAAVDGLAIGIGTTVLFHCDLVFASNRSRLATPFLDLGLVPEFGSSLAAPALMGHQRAFAMLALGEAFDAETAREAGLVWKVTEPADLEATAMEAAERLAAKPKEALRLAKRLIVDDRSKLHERKDEESRMFGERLTSDEAKSAFSAFFDRKRKAS